MNRLFFLGVAAALAASGCATTLEQQELRDAPGYQAGYGDGCATASEREKSFSTREIRDPYQFDNDKAYRAGWRQGFIECSDRAPRAPDGGRILGEEADAVF